MIRMLWQHKRTSAIIIAIVVACFLPMIVKSPYYINLMIITLVNTMLAIAFIMTLRTGLINMAIPAFWGIGAYTSAVLTLKLGMSFWVSLPMTVIITGIIAFGMGYFLIGSGSSGLAFVILSTTVGMLFPVLMGDIQYVGGNNGFPNIPPPNPIHLPFIPIIQIVSKAQFFYLALLLFVIVVLVCNAFYKSWMGRAWAAIGQTPRLAESVGINLFRYKLLAFIVCSCICGLAGCFYAHYMTFVMPSTFNMWQNIYIQIYAILGGLDYAIMGPLLGATLMTWFPEYFRFARMVSLILVGVILILLILFLPQGLLGLLQYQTNIRQRMAMIGRAMTSPLRSIKNIQQKRKG